MYKTGQKLKTKGHDRWLTSERGGSTGNKPTSYGMSRIVGQNTIKVCGNV